MLHENNKKKSNKIKNAVLRLDVMKWDGQVAS